MGRSAVIKNTVDPVWDESFFLYVRDFQQDLLKVRGRLVCLHVRGKGERGAHSSGEQDPHHAAGRVGPGHHSGRREADARDGSPQARAASLREQRLAPGMARMSSCHSQGLPSAGRAPPARAHAPAQPSCAPVARFRTHNATARAQVRLYDEDFLKSDDDLGVAQLALSSLTQGEGKPEEVTLPLRGARLGRRVPPTTPSRLAAPAARRSHASAASGPRWVALTRHQGALAPRATSGPTTPSRLTPPPSVFSLRWMSGFSHATSGRSRASCGHLGDKRVPSLVFCVSRARGAGPGAQGEVRLRVTPLRFSEHILDLLTSDGTAVPTNDEPAEVRSRQHAALSALEGLDNAPLKQRQLGSGGRRVASRCGHPLGLGCGVRRLVMSA